MIRPVGRVRLLVAGLVVAVVVAAAVVVGLRVWGGSATALEAAMADAPPASRYSWTDWAGVRAELGSDVGADSDATELEAFLDEGFDADLTSTSALLGSAPDLQRLWGFSPATIDAELFSQSTQGALLQLRVPDDYDFDALADRLTDLGYPRPDDDALAGGVWDGGPDLIGAVADVTPELAYLSLDAEDHLISASDQRTTLDPGLGELGEDLVGEEGDEVDDDGVADVVRALAGAGEPLTASIYTGDYACGALDMSQADDAAQAQADQLLAQAGKVNPLSGFAIALLPGGGGRVEMSFETDEQARTNADSRAALAAGPAPGQGGDFADRFRLGDVTADGRVVTLDVDPEPGSFLVSDLATGPLLFAAC